MRVFVLFHDDRDHDMGDTYVRGIYSTEAAATEAIRTRTASGAQSRAWGAHAPDCCSVDTWELEGAPVYDIREDDPPPDPNAPPDPSGHHG